MYKFAFASVGGTTRVRIQSGEDIRHLGELDQKMWTVLSCPTTGLEIDEQSLKLMDLDNDGHLHVNEVIRTAQWLDSTLRNLDTLFDESDTIAKDNITDEAILTVANQVSSEPTVSLAQVDAAIAAVSVEATPVPEAPYEADVIAAYKAKHDEYAAYYEQLKLQNLGLAVIPEDTPKPGLSQEDFIAMGAKIAEYEGAAKAAADADAAAIAAGQAVFVPLRKLLLVHRDFYHLLRNFVTFEDFYARDERLAIFQAGTLVIDQRACHLCLKVADMAKHDAQAAASGMFLIYCDCTNISGQKMKIVAAMTVGEIRNLTVGKNAIFYDRQGNDWDATIAKIVDNPISIRQAFWSPYRKFAKWVTDLVNKSASEKNDKAFNDMTANATTAAADPNAAKKQAFDIAKFAGIFAAIGMALGFIGSFLASLAGGVKELLIPRIWPLFLVIIGIMLIISGPAMIMAWLKLRRRNLAPVLNANGWAVNADSIVNVPFGATLTDRAEFPLIKTNDPMYKTGMSGKAKCILAIVAVLLIAALTLSILCKCGKLNCKCCQKAETEVVVAEQETTTAEDAVEMPAETAAETAE